MATEPPARQTDIGAHMDRLLDLREAQNVREAFLRLRAALPAVPWLGAHDYITVSVHARGPGGPNPESVAGCTVRRLRNADDMREAVKEMLTALEFNMGDELLDDEDHILVVTAHDASLRTIN